MADFNMTPQDLENTPIPQLLGLSVLHKGLDQGTCRIPNSKGQDKVLDYILCSETIKHLVQDLSIVHDVPWWPHYGIRFNISRSVYHHNVVAVKVPKLLPINKDEKGRPAVSQMKEEDYERIFRSTNIEEEAACLLRRTGTEAYANRINVLQSLRNLYCTNKTDSKSKNLV